jgi:hypothetical protein
MCKNGVLRFHYEPLLLKKKKKKKRGTAQQNFGGKTV